MRRRALRTTSFGVALVAVVALSACASPTPEPEVTHVKLAMGFVPTVQHSPYFVAKEKGYFIENGIDIEFDHSIVEADAVKLVGVGDIQFANVSGEQGVMRRLAFVFRADGFDQESTYRNGKGEEDTTTLHFARVEPPDTAADAGAR